MTNIPARRIRQALAAVGFTVDGLPDDMTREQSVEFLEKLVDAATAKAVGA